MTGTNNPAPPRAGVGGRLRDLGIGGAAAALLFVFIPSQESSRKVEATVKPDGEIAVKHVSGPEHRVAYRDVAGILTICDGDTHNVRPGMVETREGCLRRLEAQIVAHTQPLLRCVPALRNPQREWQLAAFASLSYNIGTGGACRSTAARLFAAGDVAGACTAFLRHNKARVSGVLRELRGLTLRRERERQICMTGQPGYPVATVDARVRSVR